MIRLFAQHRLAANLLMIMMVLAGLWAVRVMPTQLDPAMEYPLVLVDVTWPGASAEDVETLITTPIEQQLRNLNHLQELTSRTGNGTVSLRVQFHRDADMTVALDQVKQRIDTLRNLPDDMEPPRVRRLVDLEPVALLHVVGSGDVLDLIPVVRGFEQELLQRGIEAIQYDGLPEQEVALLVGGRQLSALGLTLDELAAEVRRVSQDVPAGTVGEGQGARQLRSLDQRRDPYGFEQVLIESGDSLIRLGDAADVVRRPKQGEPLVTRGGRPVIEMMLMRTTDADAYQAEQLLRRWLDEVRPTLPAGIEIVEAQNVWTLIGSQLEMVLTNGLSGLLLVVITLFAFLHGRVGWWVMVGIPVSFLLALSLFHLLFGYGISIIALIGFVMALGIVVDDAIVVGEDATTLYQAGASPAHAALAAAERMWVPVATSSLTTLAAFLPLLLVGGVAGDVILALPTALLCIILASLVECFLVLPAHLAGSLGHAGTGSRNRWRQRFDAALADWRDRRFMALVRRALDYPGATVCAALGATLVALSLVAAQHVGVAVVTGFTIESLEADVTFAATASETDKARFIDELESALAAVQAESGGDNLLGWVTRHNLANFNDEAHTGEQYASVEARYAYEEQRTLAPAAFADRWRERVTPPPWVEQLTIGVGGGRNNGQPDLSLVLRGDDLDALKQGAEELSRALTAYPGVTNVVDDLPYGRDQLIFQLTAAGRATGLTGADVGSQLRAAYSGSRVQIYNDDASELEVRVMLPDAERDDLSRLAQFPIRTPNGGFTPLASVAELTARRGIDLIRHTDARMAVTVSADVNPQVANALAVTERIRNTELPGILERHELGFGLGGKSESDQLMMSTMALGALLTLVLIYLILCWVFASYLWPLAIMSAIPFGLTGALVGHWITGWDVGAMSFLAFFALTGVVVNDSIVLISFFRRELEAGRGMRQALELAVQSRFRAVLLTSLTTIAGLSPLIFETSTLAFYMAPIAVTLCFGLAFATTLVLLVIPALILLLEDARRASRRAFLRVLPLARGASHETA